MMNEHFSEWIWKWYHRLPPLPPTSHCWSAKPQPADACTFINIHGMPECSHETCKGQWKCILFNHSSHGLIWVAFFFSYPSFLTSSSSSFSLLTWLSFQSFPPLLFPPPLSSLPFLHFSFLFFWIPKYESKNCLKSKTDWRILVHFYWRSTDHNSTNSVNAAQNYIFSSYKTEISKF